MKTRTLIMAVLFTAALSAFKMAPNATYNIDTKNSTLKWTGYHLAKSYEHTGTISIKSGSIELKKDVLKGGEIVIDMNTISNSDLTDAGKKAKLEGHLKSEDFFGVEKFPEAKIVIKSATKTSIKADLTIRGITKPIEFDYTVSNKSGQVTFNATLMVPRTDFEVMYGWKAENAILSGEFKLDVELKASK